jgi:hypothetical protein
MTPRKHIFVVHSWEEWPAYSRMMDLLANRDASIADYSVPPWKAIEGPDHVVLSGIRGRISSASAVVVLNTPGLHRRQVSTFEMETAVAMGKRVIVLQPPGNFWLPIPGALDGNVYRVAAWRSDVLGRAIRGEYAYDNRVFDIAEQAERRAIVQAIALGVGVASFALMIRSITSWRELQAELEQEGIQFERTREATGSVALHALGGGLLLGGLTALITRDPKATLAMAAAGGLGGAALGVHQAYRAALIGSRELRILTLSPD